MIIKNKVFNDKDIGNSVNGRISNSSNNNKVDLQSMENKKNNYKNKQT